MTTALVNCIDRWMRFAALRGAWRLVFLEFIKVAFDDIFADSFADAQHFLCLFSDSDWFMICDVNQLCLKSGGTLMTRKPGPEKKTRLFVLEARSRASEKKSLCFQ